MSDSRLDLDADFSAASHAKWRSLAEATLKGADFEKRLVSRTSDGLRIEPLYTREGEAATIKAQSSSAVRGQPHAGGWTIAQRIDIPDLALANQQILTDLENGANGIVIVPASPAQSGMPLTCAADVGTLMAGVYPELISISIDAGGHARRIAPLFVAWAENAGLDLARLNFNASLNPLGALTKRGRMAGDAASALRLADAVQALAARGLKGPQVLADGRPVHEAGGSEGQELAFALASAVTYLRWLTDAGLSGEEAAAAISFKITVDADQFLSIAKIRALRALWANVLAASGITGTADIHVESAYRMLTARDPWVNLLRTTVASFAGAVGGASQIALHPFSAACGIPDGFARRLARNTQVILMEESHLGKVWDPAGGSAYVEALTGALAAKGWEIFQQIEAAGGVVAALSSGLIQTLASDARAARSADIAKRKTPLTGVSEFPNVFEAAVTGLDLAAPAIEKATSERTWPQPMAGEWFGAMIDAVKAGAKVSELRMAGEHLVEAAPLGSFRLADGFEALRDAADANAATAGTRAAVFLANIGTPADFIARSTFAKNFFEAGGIIAPANDGFTDTAALVEAFKASGAAFACLCSTDAVYDERALESLRALKGAGARFVYIASRPAEGDGACASPEIDGFIYVGADVLATLQQIHHRLGIIG